MRTKRENWKHKYYRLTRDGKGRFVGWTKWKRSDPSTWVKARPLFVRPGVVYRTVIVQNWKGSRVGKRGTWTFTVDAEIYTTEAIDGYRHTSLLSLVDSLAAWICDEFGFVNASYDTKGAAVDQVRSRLDAGRLGFYVVNLDVEDVTVARGDYRFRRNIGVVNACMLAASCKRGSYSFRDRKIVAWVASKLRLCRG